MKIIDGHMHITQWERKDGKSTFKIIEDYQKENGISAIDNMSCTNNGDLWDGFEIDQSIIGSIMKLHNPSVFSHGCLYIPKDHNELEKYDFKSQLEELMEIGCDGVKICDFKPDAYKKLQVDKILDKYDEYIGYCKKYGVNMCWHVADPEFNWDPDKASEYAKKVGWFYGDSSFPTFDELINMTYRFLDAHPNLKVWLAHMFFKSNEPDEVAAMLEKYPNLNIDLAPGWEMFEGFKAHYDKWYEIFRKYSDRFIFATDITLTAPDIRINSLSRYVKRFLETDDEFVAENVGGRIIKGIKLEENHLENILYKNHERIIGEKPKEVNKAALKKYIDRYLPLMPDSKNKQMTEEYYRKNLI